MSRPLLLIFALLLLMPLAAVARVADPPGGWQQSYAPRDLAQIRQSGTLRVLINQSRNSSGVVDGQPIGTEYLRLRAFEQYLNATAPGARRIRLQLLPRPKDQLLAALRRGEGDLVAPGELLGSATPPGLIPSAPSARQVALVVVSRQGGRRFLRPEQLAGQDIALVPGSAAGAAIERLNDQLAQRRRAPVKVEWVDPSLAVEDVLEMVQAGIYPLTVVEQPIAERWAKVLPKLRVERHLVLAEPADMHWFSREGATLLQQGIDRFLADYRAPAGQDAAFVQAYRRLYQMQNPLARTERERLERLRPLLQRYARQHALDWLSLAALAFKESTLDPSAQGAGGAVGLLQITPTTARSVGVSRVQELENNVQAGARYLSRLRRDYFDAARLDERERMAFMLAAYNLGPQRVQDLRDEAKRRGLDPNRWFFQVERVALEDVGSGVVSYVNSINKYYLAYDRGRQALETPRRP